MLFGLTTLRTIVFALAMVPLSATAASAAGSNEVQYASFLRTINPHLQVHQSLAFARSVFADAERANLDPRLIVALVTVESHWRPNAVSRVGARGLGQLMPETAATLGVNAWDPMQNIHGAATYLRAMVDHFAGSGNNTMRFAIGAYNAGPHAVDRYHGIPPFTETRNYVTRVLATWRKIKVHLGHALFAEHGIVAPSLATADARLWLATPNASALPVSVPAAAEAAAPVPLNAAEPAAAP